MGAGKLNRELSGLSIDRALLAFQKVGIGKPVKPNKRKKLFFESREGYFFGGGPASF